jgi:hypothetical protein
MENFNTLIDQFEFEFKPHKTKDHISVELTATHYTLDLKFTRKIERDFKWLSNSDKFKIQNELYKQIFKDILMVAELGQSGLIQSPYDYELKSIRTYQYDWRKQKWFTIENNKIIYS